ncbi:hypothetical protein D3C87_1095750 [compost metagenome]
MAVDRARELFREHARGGQQQGLAIAQREVLPAQREDAVGLRGDLGADRRIDAQGVG